MEEARPAVELEGVSKAFGGKQVLKDLTFQVSAGEAFCLLGRSGVGKSITLKLIIGLLRPDRGRIFVDGKDLESLKDKELGQMRTRIGFLFQGGALFDSISVYDNVAFPLRRHTGKPEKEIRDVVREKLKEVELEKEGSKMPSELSGGMSKRVGLARALALDPDVLLADEPSSGLDRITANEIYDLLLELKKRRKVTLVAVTHDVTGARRFADRFAVLSKGKILGCGSADELSKSDNPLVRELASGSET